MVFWSSLILSRENLSRAINYNFLMFQVQYCEKEMEANFAEIREIRRTNC